jgi:hypothetical protein
VAAGVVVLLAGCGRRGDPEPPLRAIPATTQDLVVAQRGGELRVAFGYPQTTVGGQPLPQLARVELWQLAREAPPGAPPEQPLPQPTEQEFAAAAQLLAAFEGAELTQAVVGDRLIFVRPLPEPPAGEQPVWTFAVKTAASRRDTSDFSNRVPLTPARPPEPPSEVTVDARLQGIEVRWTPPEPAPGSPPLAGYLIYRRDPKSREWGEPLALVPPEVDRFLDESARIGESYVYTVTAALSREPRVESALASAREVIFRDAFPPPAPAGLVGLPEAGRVRLLWEPSRAADVVGYRVYRRTATTAMERLTPEPVGRTEYLDEAVTAGTVYRYRITAIDQSGNESAASGEIEIDVR